MPASITGAGVDSSFIYDGDGNRVLKTEGGQTTLYVNQYYEINLTTQEKTTHYYLGGRQIAYNKGGTLTYVHQDHLGGTNVTTDSSGAEKSTVKYFPFGDTRSTTGTLSTDKMFTGQRLDQTGLYFYNARYYDATIGRFISPDTIVPNPANPQSLNRYSYCLNNPLKYIDPTGHTNIWESLTRGIVEQYLIDNWDDPNNTYITDSGRTLGRALSSSDPAGMFDVIAPEGIDSDWADMLDEDGVGWGSKVQLQTGSDYVTSFILEPTLDCYAQLLNWSIYTTGQRDQGNIHTLRVYDSVTGKRVGKAKLNDGNGWWDRNGDNVKIIGAAVGGCLIMATGFGVIAGAGVIFAAGVTGGTAYTAIVAASVAAPIAYGGYAVMDAGLQVATSSDKKQVSFPTLPPGANLE